MKGIVIILSVFVAFICKAQTPLPPGDLPGIAQLKQQGIDTIVVYNSAFNPRNYFRSLHFDDYEIDDFKSSIIFWRKNGKSFFYYKSNSVYYPVHEFMADSIWNFYTTNRAAIDTETFKKPLLKRVNTETEEVTTAISIQRFNAEMRRIELNINGALITKIFDHFDFQEFGISGEENLSYTYNLNTKSARLQQLIERIFIRTLKDEKPIKKPHN